MPKGTIKFAFFALFAVVLIYLGSGLMPGKTYSLVAGGFEIVDNPASDTIDIYITDTIGGPSSYTTLADFIRHYPGPKELRMVLNTPGGMVVTGSQILSALEEARVPVTSVVDGWALSMGAILTFATPTIDIKSNSLIMFHNISSGGGGLIPGPIQESFLVMLRSGTRGILSETEIQAIVEGKEVWFSSKEAVRRICLVGRLAGTDSDVRETCSKAKSYSPEQVIHNPGV